MRFLKVVSVIVALYLVAAGVYSIGYTVDNSLNITSLIHAGGQIEQEYGVDFGEIYVHPDSGGYDGAAYYYIAIDPSDLARISRYPDYTFRYQRITYPLIVYILSLGSADTIPLLLFSLNLACVIILAFIFSKNHGMKLYVVAIPGIFIAVLHDLVEPLWALAIASAFIRLKKRPDLSALLFSFAFLTKETTVVIVGPVFLYYALSRKWKKAKLMLIPFIVYTLWQVTLLGAFGQLPSVRLKKFAFSATGFGDSFVYNLTNPNVENLPVILLQLTVPLFILVSFSALRCERNEVTTTFLLTSLVLPFLHPGLWIDINAASRNILPQTLMALLYFKKSGDWRIHLLIGPQVMVTMALFGFYLLTALPHLL